MPPKGVRRLAPSQGEWMWSLCRPVVRKRGSWLDLCGCDGRRPVVGGLRHVVCAGNSNGHLAFLSPEKVVLRLCPWRCKTGNGMLRHAFWTTYAAGFETSEFKSQNAIATFEQLLLCSRPTLRRVAYNTVCAGGAAAGST